MMAKKYFMLNRTIHDQQLKTAFERVKLRSSMTSSKWPLRTTLALLFWCTWPAAADWTLLLDERSLSVWKNMLTWLSVREREFLLFSLLNAFTNVFLKSMSPFLETFEFFSYLNFFYNLRNRKSQGFSASKAGFI